MTDIDPLVTSADSDWSKFQNDDPAFFLPAAGQVIRKFLGWHVYPNIETTVENIPVGNRGIIILPTRYVTAVSSLQIAWHNGPLHTITADCYKVYATGYLLHTGWPHYNNSFATVTFNHGYDDLPAEVKTVAFELAEQAQTMRAGNLSQLQAPGGFVASTTQPFGLNLNDDQKNRLSSFRVGFVK
ncbi:hypothetical protein [Mycobacterium paragordonae]|uniref:hypothetical protein n=1 Tax=Mycobacterium paragordonae TaxID=1389713 RepID=UPI0012E27C97|nr:hypothetical protein [Mycobacterium paragordonae]